MRFLATICLGVLAMSVLTAAPVPKEKEKEKPKDEEAILGIWRVKSMDLDAGKFAVPAEFTKIDYVFGEKNAMTKFNNGNATLEGTFKLDPAAKRKTLDLTKKDGTQILCLYELNGNSLKLCYTLMPGAARPTELKGDANTVTTVFVMERVKEEKK